MGVVKNLMVRVGADLSGMVNGFNKGANAGASFSKKTKKAMMESAASMNQLKNAMAQGGKNAGIVSLTDRIRELEAEQKALSELGFSWGYEGFEGNVTLLRELKGELQAYVDEFNKPPDGPREWVSQLRDLLGVQSQLRGQEGTVDFTENQQAIEDMSAKVLQFTDGLQASVDASLPLGARLNAAKDALREMERAGLGVGDDPWDAMYQSVASLSQEVRDYKNSLTAAEHETDELAQATEEVERNVKSWPRSVVSWFASKIGSIGKGAKSSNAGIEGLTRTIKRFGLVAVGLKLTKAVFGELQGVVSRYISENERMQAQNEALKNGLGQALAPAINLVSNALSAAMPYIIGVSNAIGELVTNLFGNGWTTVADDANAAASATSSATAAQKEYNRTLAGFDEITKLGNSSSSSGGASSSTTTTIAGTLPAWLTDLSTQITNAVNNGDYSGVGAAIATQLGRAVDSSRQKLNNKSFRNKVTKLVNKATSTINGFFDTLTAKDGSSASIAENIGGLVGDGITLGLSTLDQFLEEVDFSDAGKALSQTVNGAIGSMNVSDTSFGTVIADALNAGFDFANGALKELDWSSMGKLIWKNVSDFISNLEWSTAFSAIGTAAGGIGTMIWDSIVGGLTSTWDYFKKQIEDAGGNIAIGILNGIGKGLASIGKWVLNNVLDPLVDGLKSTPFGAKIVEAMKLEDILAAVERGLDKLDVGITLDTEAKFVSFKDARKSRLLDSVAKISSVNTANIKNTAVTMMAKLNSYQSNLKNPYLSVKANLTSMKDKLTKNEKTVNVRANATTWKDSLGNKTVTIKANVVKDWSGTLAKKLGIDKISSKLQLQIPTVSVDWKVHSSNGSSVSVPNYQVTWNAVGGILQGAQLFGRIGNTFLGGGEAGREAVLPLDRNTWWMDKIAERVVQRFAGGNGGEQNITIQLVLDGKIVTQTVVRNINAQARSTGKNPLAAYL